MGSGTGALRFPPIPACCPTWNPVPAVLGPRWHSDPRCPFCSGTQLHVFPFLRLCPILFRLTSPSSFHWSVIYTQDQCAFPDLRAPPGQHREVDGLPGASGPPCPQAASAHPHARASPESFW